MFVHEKFDTLYEHIPKRILPPEYGGDAESVAEIANSWKNTLIENSQWFKEDSFYKSEESKRVGKSKNADLLFGTEGSFRNLEFD